MTLDLNIYGLSYFELHHEGKPDPEVRGANKNFLSDAGISPWRWYRRPWQRWLARAPRQILGACRPAAGTGVKA